MNPITDNAALVEFCNSVKGAPFIAVDTEFMRETTYWPKLCLIQAATPEHEAVIDPLAEGIDLTPFLDILKDPATVKVFHAARQDVEIFNKLGAMPRPLFDTQAAAMAAGFGDQVSYDSLVRQMLNKQVDKGSRFTDWARRPLTPAQYDYALADVTHLAQILRTGVTSGMIDPFHCRITGQDGSVKNSGRHGLDLEQIAHMDWLCDAVDGHIPEYDELAEVSKPMYRMQGIHRDLLPVEKEAEL